MKAVTTKEIRDSIGWEVTCLRVGLGYSQERLAEEAGCSRSTIAHIEIGNQAPSLGLVYRLCEVLKCEPGDILKPL